MRYLILGSRLMSDFKLVGLQVEIQVTWELWSFNVWIHVRVICFQGKLPPHQVVPQALQSQLDCQAFLLHCGVPGLSWELLPAHVCNGLLFTCFSLDQDCSDPHSRSIYLNDELLFRRLDTCKHICPFKVLKAVSHSAQQIGCLTLLESRLVKETAVVEE